MKPVIKLSISIFALLLFGCTRNSKYTAFENPKYIDIEVVGAEPPKRIRVSDSSEIREIVETIDFSFIDESRYYISSAVDTGPLWIWTTYPYSDADGHTYPVSFSLQKDGKVCFAASMIRSYQISNTRYRDAVLKIAKRHLIANAESIDVLNNTK